jgi:hypothetical protein
MAFGADDLSVNGNFKKVSNDFDYTTRADNDYNSKFALNWTAQSYIPTGSPATFACNELHWASLTF